MPSQVISDTKLLSQTLLLASVLRIIADYAERLDPKRVVVFPDGPLSTDRIILLVVQSVLYQIGTTAAAIDSSELAQLLWEFPIEQIELLKFKRLQLLSNRPLPTSRDPHIVQHSGLRLRPTNPAYLTYPAAMSAKQASYNPASVNAQDKKFDGQMNSKKETPFTQKDLPSKLKTLGLETSDEVKRRPMPAESQKCPLYSLSKRPKEYEPVPGLSRPSIPSQVGNKEAQTVPLNSNASGGQFSGSSAGGPSKPSMGESSKPSTRDSFRDSIRGSPKISFYEQPFPNLGQQRLTRESALRVWDAPVNDTGGSTKAAAYESSQNASQKQFPVPKVQPKEERAASINAPRHTKTSINESSKLSVSKSCKDACQKQFPVINCQPEKQQSAPIDAGFHCPMAISHEAASCLRQLREDWVQGKAEPLRSGTLYAGRYKFHKAPETTPEPVEQQKVVSHTPEQGDKTPRADISTRLDIGRLMKSLVGDDANDVSKSASPEKRPVAPATQPTECESHEEQIGVKQDIRQDIRQEVSQDVSQDIKEDSKENTKGDTDDIDNDFDDDFDDDFNNSNDDSMEYITEKDIVEAIKEEDIMEDINEPEKLDDSSIIKTEHIEESVDEEGLTQEWEILEIPETKDSPVKRSFRDPDGHGFYFERGCFGSKGPRQP